MRRDTMTVVSPETRVGDAVAGVVDRVAETEVGDDHVDRAHAQRRVGRRGDKRYVAVGAQVDPETPADVLAMQGITMGTSFRREFR